MKQHVPGTYAKILSQEVRLLQVLDHPNIIKLYRMIETEQDYYIIMYVTGVCVRAIARLPAYMGVLGTYACLSVHECRRRPLDSRLCMDVVGKL